MIFKLFFHISIFLSNVIGFYGNINNLFFNYYISNMQIKININININMLMNIQ